MTDRDYHIRIAILGALVLFLLIVLPSWAPRQLRFDTLDGGYRATLNDHRLQSLNYGTELVTTAGPLGFLRNRDYWPGRFLQKLSWDLLITIAMCMVIVSVLRKRRPLVCTLFAIAMLAILAIVKFDIFRLTTCLPVLFLFSRLENNRRFASFTDILLILALAIGAWVLFSYLLLFTLVVFFTEMIFVFKFKRIPLSWMLYLILICGIWIGTGNEMYDLLNYIPNSLEVAKGYTNVMLRPGGFFELLPLILAFIILEYNIFINTKKSDFSFSFRLIFATTLGVIFLIVYRSAFVRFEVMRGLESSVTVALFALFGAIFWSSRVGLNRSAWIAPLIAMVITLFGAAGLVMNSSNLSLGTYARSTLRVPTDQVSSLLALITNSSRFGKDWEKNTARTKKQFPLDRLKGPVDMHGNLQGLIIANGLEYSPRPVFQSFDAYTPRLAHINGEFLRGPQAPETVIVELQPSLGHPHGLLDAESWLEIFQAYESQGLIRGIFGRKPDGLLVLRRTSRRAPFRLVKISDERHFYGEKIMIPETVLDRPVWAEVEAQKTVFGSIGRTFLKLPAEHIDIFLRNGQRWSLKFASDPAQGGFLLSPQIRSVDDLDSLLTLGLSSAPSRLNVIAFRVWQDDGPFSKLTRNILRIRLYALEREMAETVSSSARKNDIR